MPIRDNFSDAHLERWLDDKRATEIECLVPDLTGVARGKILPREKFTEERGMRLPESVLGMTVTAEAPSDPAYLRIIAPTDRDISTDNGGEPSQAFVHYIGGLQKYLSATMALLATM